MLARVLYRDASRALELNYLGFGALRVVRRDGSVRLASSAQKQFLLVCVDALKQLGVPIAPGSVPLQNLALQFIELIEHGSAFDWQVAMSHSPAAVAAMAASAKYL